MRLHYQVALHVFITSFFCSLIFQLQDTETISGESEVKFQVSRDTLGAMLRSMAYIREQLSAVVSFSDLTMRPILYILITNKPLYTIYT